MEHGPHRGHREVGLKVRAVIPAIGANPLTPHHAERRQRLGTPGHRIKTHGLETRAVEAPHGAATVQPRAVAQNHLRREWQVHHGRLHGRSAEVHRPAPDTARTNCSSAA